MTTATRKPTKLEANTYQIRARQDGHGVLHASGLGAIGLVRKPQIIRDIYTCEQLLNIGRIIGLDRAGLVAMIAAAE